MLRKSVWLVVIAAVLTATFHLGCESTIFDITARYPTKAQYQEMGTSCAVQIFFNQSVQLRLGEKPEYYALGTGEPATDAALIPGYTGVVVTFPRAVLAADSIIVGAGTDNATVVSLQPNERDAVAPTMIEAVYAANAEQPTIVLRFSEGMDEFAAADTDNFLITGTIEHPVAARVINCGDEIELVFERLSADSSITIRNLVDANGIPVEGQMQAKVLQNEEEDRPEVLSVLFNADDQAGIVITFDEAVDITAAETVTNYLIHPAGVTPASAVLQSGGRSVLLTTEALEEEIKVDVSGVTDLSGRPMIAQAALQVASPSDSTLPTIVGAFVSGRNGGVEVDLLLSEGVTAGSATNENQYLLFGDGEEEGLLPTGIDLVNASSTVRLTFDYIPANAMLFVDGLRDFSGNVLSGQVSVGEGGGSDQLPPMIVAARFVPNSETPTIDISFDEAISEASAEDVGNYSVRNANSSSVDLLSNGRTVRATFAAMSSTDVVTVQNVRDLAGNELVTVVDLAIESGDDDSAPTLDKATFAIDAPLPQMRVAFSEAVDRTTAETVANYKAVGSAVAAVGAALQDDGHTVLVTFRAVPSDTDITVSGVKDLSGITMTTATEAPVHYADDIDAPTLVSAQYVSDALTPTVELTFSEAVDKSRAESVGLYLTGVTRVTPNTATIMDDGRRVRLTFTRMSLGETIEIRSIQDLNRNTIDTVSSFTIDDAPDYAGPYVLSATFQTSTTTPTVVLVFSEAIDETFAETLSAFKRSGTSESAITAVLGDDSRTVTITMQRLAIDSRIRITQVKDLGGNLIATGSEVSIAKGTDTAVPTVVSATVTSSNTIKVVFSEPVDMTSAETSTNYTGLAGSVSPVVQTDGKSVVLSMLSGTVAAGAKINIAGVKDLHGNVMATVTNLTLQ